MDKSEEQQDSTPQTVFYGEEDHIWIVAFWKTSNENILGGDCSIAIKEENGEILRIWFGE